MIFRLTQKLATKIKVETKDTVPLCPNPFADWSGHLFTADRMQYIILTNTAALYSSVMPGRGISSDHQLIERALSEIREVMAGDGLEFFHLQHVAPASETIQFSKSLNRSVTGSINDLVYHAQMWLTEGGLSPHDTSLKLNEMPMSAIDYKYPRDAMKALGTEVEVEPSNPDDL